MKLGKTPLKQRIKDLVRRLQLEIDRVCTRLYLLIMLTRYKLYLIESSIYQKHYRGFIYNTYVRVVLFIRIVLLNK